MKKDRPGPNWKKIDLGLIEKDAMTSVLGRTYRNCIVLYLSISIALLTAWAFQKCSRPQQLTLFRSLHAEALQAIAGKGLVEGPYMAARAGFEPTTLRSNGVVSTNAPPCPTNTCSFTQKPKMIVMDLLNSAQTWVYVGLVDYDVCIQERSQENFGGVYLLLKTSIRDIAFSYILSF